VLDSADIQASLLLIARGQPHLSSQPVIGLKMCGFRMKIQAVPMALLDGGRFES
jgi:hypothetical protein